MSRRPRLTRLRARLVTGPLARGFAFAVDFTAGLGNGLLVALKGLTRR